VAIDNATIPEEAGLKEDRFYRDREGVPMAVKSLAELQLADLIRGKTFTKSPVSWEDEVLYFLLVDRFSDGKEKGYRDLGGAVVTTGTTELFQPADAQNAVGTEADAKKWRDAGLSYVGGNLPGLKSKLGYLKRMGVTGLWLRSWRAQKRRYAAPKTRAASPPPALGKGLGAGRR
jgi:hypothetical protein